jgi:dihydroflavonol-4-reductase
VRSLSNPKKVQHLRELCPGAAHELELVEADLNSEAGWDEAVKDCTYILHVASPFPLKSPKDKYEVIKPAVEGTMLVLQAASRMSVPPKRVVVTSSVVAMSYGQNVQGVKFTDENWTVVDDPANPVSPYVESKTLAERAAWKFQSELPEHKKFEMVTVNPVLVMGPLLSSSDCTSVDIIKQVLLGQIPALPNLIFNVVSVFDVVRAHFLAMTKPEAAGKRFMVHGANISMPQISDVLVEEFRPKGYAPTTMRVSKWFLSFIGRFDEETRGILPMIDCEMDLYPNNARDILGMKLNVDGPGMIKEIIYAAIHAGLIEDKSKDKTITSSYVRPEIDLTGIPRADEV